MEYRTGRSCLPYGKLASNMRLRHLAGLRFGQVLPVFSAGKLVRDVVIAVGDCSFRRRFLWGRKSNEFAQYELPCLFLPTGKNRRRTVDLFLPPRAHFPGRPGELLCRYFFYGTIEAAWGNCAVQMVCIVQAAPVCIRQTG